MKVLYSSINGFFNTNPIGKVLNRMSGDLAVIDRQIPFSLDNFIWTFSNLVINIVLVVIFTSWYMAIIYMIIFYIVWKMRVKFSIANIVTSKYQSVTKSPYFALFSDFVHGNYIIKTFKKEEHYFQKLWTQVSFSTVRA